MAEFPFQVAIKPVSSSTHSETITCVGLLREVGEKREVLDAVWDRRPVIAKIFADPIKAKCHMRREWRGLKLLAERGLNSPTPLFCGRSEQHNWVVVTEKIVDALTVRELWDNTTDRAKKCELLCRVSRELARQHSKGVLQKDLHLGNFMLQEDKLFALDPSQMRFLCGEVDRNRAIGQLALLASSLPEEDGDGITSVCQEYVKARSWELGPSETATFWKILAGHRRKGIKKGLEKCLRTSRRHQKVQQRAYNAVVARELFEEVDFHKFVESIDKLMQDGQILKDGNSSFVSRVRVADREIVVKRYNHRGIVHSVRHTIKKSRARRGWLHAHRFGMLNIATPRPLAYIEQRRGMLVWKSYLVTEYVNGQKLYDFLRDNRTTREKCSEVTAQIKVLLEKLGKHRITHGDLKHTNILVTGSGPVLTDLDAVRVHKSNWTYKLRRAKDLRPLMSLGPSGHVVC